MDATQDQPPPIPSLSRTITPGYMAAVMSSPDVLCNLCQQYFRQYDRDGNGLLDCGEALNLAKDLGGAMAVPLGSSEEVLRPSLKRFSEAGRDALTLEEFSRWFPSVLGLEPLSPQHIEAIKNAPVREPSLTRSITPGYIAAVTSSPQTMQAFCKQFFRQYDANGDGVLELQELQQMTKDLSVSLGISLDESRLRLDTATSSGDAALSLEAFCQWLPQLVKKRPSEAQEGPNKSKKSYLKALKGSPRILVQLCRQYFREYDRNQNSVLEDAELTALAADLSVTMDVSLGSPLELRKSMGPDAMTFPEFARWFAEALDMDEAQREEVKRLA